MEAGHYKLAKLSGGMIDWDAADLPVRKDASCELSGQCDCKLKTRVGKNPLIAKQEGAASPGAASTKLD